MLLLMHSPFLFALSLLSILANVYSSSHSLDSNVPAICWNVSAITSSTTRRQILKGVVGSGGQGKLHALMGPSGSGKTTLLNILAGVIPKNSLKIFGEINMTEGFASERIYVQQEDLLFAQLTVTETLDTSFSLKSAERANDKVVGKLISDLGLKNVRFTRVGDAKTRGLSGGEKKRLSIGNELVGADISGLLIFADEPTSGLDSFQAERVVQLLKKLATNGNTVIVSIHQPRASIYQLFDEITLLADGKTMYSGSTKDIQHHFSALGYPCPLNMNPTEHFIDIVSMNYTTIESEKICKDRIELFATTFAKQNEKKVKASVPVHLLPVPSSVIRNTRISPLKLVSTGIRKFQLLLKRAWRQVTRDKALNIARFSSSLFSALLFGAIYFQLGSGASTVADRLGLLQVAAVNTAMTALIKATTTFVSEKLIVQRERRSGAYTVAPYFFSKLLAELPLSAFFPCMTGAIIYKLCGLNSEPGRMLKFLLILTVESMASTSLGLAVGSFAPSVEAGIAIAPAVMVLFIVFGGLYVVNAPTYLAWIANTSLIRWSYEALCVNEFSGLTFIPEAPVGPLAVTKGEQVLQSIGYASSTVSGALLAQFAIIATNYAFTYFMLLAMQPKSEPLRSAAVDHNESDVTDNTSNKKSKLEENVAANSIPDKKAVKSTSVFPKNMAIVPRTMK